MLNAPESFEGELAGLRNVEVLRALTGVKQIEFSLAFVIKMTSYSWDYVHNPIDSDFFESHDPRAFAA